MFEVTVKCNPVSLEDCGNSASEKRWASSWSCQGVGGQGGHRGGGGDKGQQGLDEGGDGGQVVLSTIDVAFCKKKNFYRLHFLQSVKDEREGGAEDVQQSQPCNHPVEDGRGSGQVG